MVRKDYFHDANDALITTLEASDIEEYKVMEKKEKFLQVLLVNSVFGNMLLVCTCIIQRVVK